MWDGVQQWDVAFRIASLCLVAKTLSFCHSVAPSDSFATLGPCKEEGLTSLIIATSMSAESLLFAPGQDDLAN